MQLGDCLYTTIDEELPCGETRVRDLTDERGFVESVAATDLSERAAPFFWILLDSESTVDMICNPALVRKFEL